VAAVAAGAAIREDRIAGAAPGGGGVVVPETEVHASHARSGHRWVDLVLAGSAMLVSIVSLAIAIRHGQTMEKMAEANARLVAANSWPFLQYSTSNEGDDGKPLIRLSVINAGVGPARVETLEVFWHGAPVASPQALLAACCGLAAGTEQTARFNYGLLTGRIVRAAEAVTLLEVRPEAAAGTVWQRLDRERLHVKFRACYCSVFDECWTSSLVGTRATPVARCPVPPVPFAIPGTEDLER